MLNCTNVLRLTARLSVVLPFAALLYAPSPGWATPLLPADLASFAVLGAQSVTNVPTSTIGGNLGASPGTSIDSGYSFTSGSIQSPSPTALSTSAQSQLGVAPGTAIVNLASLGAGTLEPADLVGLTLPPGVYTVPAASTNLSGTLTLDGGGNANAGWVFQMPSTLKTSSGSVVKVINTGAGAGVYWNVGSDATLGSTTSFEGNILALNNITLVTGATIGCGRVLAHVASVIMDDNTIDTGCTTDLGGSTTLLAGSKGLSGGLDVTTGPEGTVVSFLPFVPVGSGGPSVPEPSTLLLLGSGLAGLAGVAWRRHSK